VKEILEGNKIGIAVGDFEKASVERGVDDLLALLEEKDIHDRCAAAAKRLFSLEDGAIRYREIYQSMIISLT
jgi:hypothetical protein